MECCDFASVAKIIRDDLLEGNFDNQTDFAETLFSSYLEESNVYFDMGLLNKWLNGLARLSPAIGQFYRRDAKNREALAITLEDAIIPSLSDSAMHILEQHHLTEYHDCYAQIINYAMLLGDMGEPEKAEQLIRDVNPHSYDHGILLQAKGTLQLSIGDMVHALSSLLNSLYCFSKVFEGDETLIAEKRKELEGLLQMVGLPQDTAQELLTGE